MNSMKYFSLIAVFFVLSCSNKKQDWIVKAQNGKYYRLEGNASLGNDRYELKEIDTTYIKVKF